MRLPKVMVPVLSSSRVSTSPAASTARPDLATTLAPTRRSMPEMPIAESRPLMVVGIRVISSATRYTMGICTPEYWAKASRPTTTMTKIRLRPANRMFSAISLGVFWRLAPSTRPIILSRKASPGLVVMRTVMASDTTRVPPVTLERSPPLSRITGADSPVMADSSTEAMPATTSPSLGMVSPASTSTRSPFFSCGLGTSS